MKRRTRVAGILVAIILGMIVAAAWYRQERVVAHGHFCTNQLMQIDAAKEQFAQAAGLTNGAVTTQEQIAPYMWRGMPRCPSGGAYTINPVGVDPTCSLGVDGWLHHL